MNDKIKILDRTKGKEAARLPEESSPGLETASDNIIAQFYENSILTAKSIYESLKNVTSESK